MPIETNKLKVLHILSQNLQNPSPGLVASSVIAGKLNISVKETQLLLKIMNDMGVIESDVDHHHSLITRKGLNYLERQSIH